MSNLVSHAENELRLAKLLDKNSDYGGMLGEAVLRMVKLFSDEGHSGMSANMVINIFEKIARFEPLTPLTGENDEWTEVHNGCFQNRRCPHVFKEGGKAYDTQGKIFREPNGACFQNSNSRVSVTFPYIPKTEYVDVEFQ